MRSRGAAADGTSLPSALLAGSLASDPGTPATEPEDQDTGDLPIGVDEDELDQDEIDTDQVTSRD